MQGTCDKHIRGIDGCCYNGCDQRLFDCWHRGVVCDVRERRWAMWKAFSVIDRIPWFRGICALIGIPLLLPCLFLKLVQGANSKNLQQRRNSSEFLVCVDRYRSRCWVGANVGSRRESRVTLRDSSRPTSTEVATCSWGSKGVLSASMLFFRVGWTPAEV